MPQQYIDFAYVKQHASFERVIAGYNLKLFGSGSQRSLLCPFHRERNPSCKLDLSKGIFHCFGCQAKGNILEFAARMEGDPDDLRAAALKVAAFCGIDPAPPREDAGPRPAPEHRGKGARPQRSPPSSSQPRNRKRTRAAAPGPEAETETLTDRSFDGEAAGPINPPLTFTLKLDPHHAYLRERGLSAALVEQFGLGYCSRGSMAGRICIPIHNERGELVAYAGRWPGEAVPVGQERYKLPKHFQKSRVLFNLHRVGDTEHLVLVEGYWSTIRLHALGAPAAALMGSSVSEEQIALLRDRGIRFLTVLWDGDEAGHSARERMLLLLAATFFVAAPVLQDGQKPDTLGEAELRALVERPVL